MGDDDFWRRKLSKQSSLVVLDELFFEEGNGRDLNELTDVTLAECNARKKEMYTNLLSSLDDIVSVECASFLLSPSIMECILIV